ncbi:MAG TPA: alpha/beta fold hydrolase [Acetobacteraceae bacterium]|jgi:pimeloyl-ACP methyl ester carboxylesterase
MQKNIIRRGVLQAGVVAPLAFAGPAGAQSSGSAKTYVLVHGSWCGGWFFDPVADHLREAGHRVLTPTQTGLGERKHLLSKDITLQTFIEDISNVIEWEELHDVILVGHSSAGGPITGVVDRMPDRVRHVVYLDAIILQNGQSFFSASSPDVAATRRKQAQEVAGTSVIPPPLKVLESFLGIRDASVQDWFKRRMTPHPIATYETPLKLNTPTIGAGRPCTFVAFTGPGPEPSRQWAKSQPGWKWTEVKSGHAAPVIVPEQVSQVLDEIA